jgi:hypothetical protein
MERIHMIGLDESELIEVICYVSSRRTPFFTEQYPYLPLVLQQRSYLPLQVNDEPWKFHRAGI